MDDDEDLPDINFTPVTAQQRDALEEARVAGYLQSIAAGADLQTQQGYGPAFARQEALNAQARGTEELRGIFNTGNTFYQGLHYANPSLQLAQGQTDRYIREAGPSAIQSELQDQALRELRLGGGLSADERYEATQGARVAANARGTVGGNRAFVNEVLNRTNLSEQRKGQRRAFASAVDSKGYQEKAADRAFALQGAGFAAAYYDPQVRLYGASGSAATGRSGVPTYGGALGSVNSVYGSNQSAALQAASINAANERAAAGIELGLYESQATDRRQEAGFAYDREDTIRNAGYASDISDRNNSAATTSAAIGAGGAIVGGLLIAF